METVHILILFVSTINPIFNTQKPSDNSKIELNLSGETQQPLLRQINHRAYLDFAVTPHVAGPTVAVVVVDELYTVQSARASTRVAEALVDVSLTPRSYKPCWTVALEASHAVHTRAVVVASARHTVVYVDLTDDAKSTCTGKV